MSTLDLLPSKDDIADALRHLTGRSDSQRHSLAGFGIFAAGVLAGAALAVLFAPKPGAELRQEIGARIGDVHDKLVKAEESAAESSEPA